MRRRCLSVVKRAFSSDSPFPMEIVDSSKGPIPPPRVFRREALQLYRDILRASRQFTWMHSSGYSWKHILQAQARQEFEDARKERDPAVIARMIIVGQQGLIDIQEKMMNKELELQKKIEDSKNPANKPNK